MPRPTLLPLLALALAACNSEHIIGSIDRGEAGLLPDMPPPAPFDRVLHLPSSTEINLRIDNQGTFRWVRHDCSACVGDAGRWFYATPGAVTLVPPAGSPRFSWPVAGGAIVSVDSVDFIAGSGAGEAIAATIGFMDTWRQGRVCAVCCGGGGADGGVATSDLGFAVDMATGPGKDLGVAPDLVAGKDLGVAADLAAPRDLATASDLITFVDLGASAQCRGDGGQLIPLRVDTCDAPASPCSLP